MANSFFKIKSIKDESLIKKLAVSFFFMSLIPYVFIVLYNTILVKCYIIPISCNQLYLP